MQANKAFYVIGAIVVLVISLMLWFLFGSGSSARPANEKVDVIDAAFKDLSPEELREMGIEGDTPRDTIKTLVGNSKANNKKIEEVINQNEQLLRENERLKNQQANLDYQIQQSVQNETSALMSQLNELKTQIMDNKQMVENNQGFVNQNTGTGQDSTIQINGARNSNPNYSANDASQGMSNNGVNWVSPSDYVLDRDGKPINNNALGNNTVPVKAGLPFTGEADSTVVQENSNTTGSSRNNRNARPFYTIAANSTLTNSVALTALVGRVPIDNNVTEPYPFKLLIGRENLIANGIELPDVEGAIVSGTASGDWTLSCVRGKVNSLTFVFSDGRIVNVTNAGAAGESEKLGWLSDPFGVPCIPGERKTNAPEYLASNAILMGASAAAQGLSQSQITNVVDNGAIVGAVTGNNGQYVLGQALGGGLRETAEWFRQRYGQTFDAVYVPPGHQVAVHIDKEIKIDYDRNGRKVKYGQSQAQFALD